jgi:secreted trypsin-like serine protease
MRRLLILPLLLTFALPAAAMVGGAPAVDAAAYRSEVMILSGRGNLCTGIVLAQDLVLTAAHCFEPGLDYKLYELDAERQPVFHDIARRTVHPQFSKAQFDANRATADLALVKVAKPLPARYLPATLSGRRPRVAVGERFAAVGYGVTAPRDNRSAAVLRRADLVATGQPGNLQLRLVDPATKGDAPGLGACTGDSGGPVYQERDGKRFVYGVISWTTGPRLGDGCGGLTGATPLELHLKWIAETARKLGSPLAARAP